MTDEDIVFLVDDDEAVREALSLSLRQGGFVIEIYASGPDFLSAYGGDRRGCLLIDLCMPRMSGLEVQEELKKRNIQMPVIFMTGYGTPQATKAALEAGAFEFLNKPIPRSILHECIRKALSRASATEGLSTSRSGKK
jgi:two-component system response regulator FixJ